ncbi:nucleotidyltransferase [Streptococcus dentapri]|uniref:tRNA(Met) cytidine acetate ligase n=1 Tax=Streptococcus dentapri TaxID=573564 RepID=A0ABV8D3U4_9STRE
MTVTGIIAEFNPFHNGHKYLLNQADGVKIVAMSGNFVQRGEPAIIDKWTRAQLALENGADLVVELPFLVAVQSADYFAQGAVAILSQLGIDTLAFGSEERLDYQKLSESYKNKQEEMEQYLSSLSDELSYPQKTQLMWKHFADVDFSGNTPNHILGLAYAKACAGKNIQLKPIQRVGASFHSQNKTQGIASATAIRQHMSDSQFVAQTVPNASAILNKPQVTWEDYFGLLKYQMLTNSDLTSIVQVNDELASRLHRAIKTATTVDELVEAVATKRYTRARVRRLLTYILIGVREADLPQAVHILGFTEQGRQHLADIKDKTQLISRIGSQPWDALTQKADRVYQLGNPKIAEQTWGRVPIRVKDK